jgi:hypothetical protein
VVEMLRGFRIVAIGAVVLASVSIFLFEQAGAGPPPVDPGVQAAQQVLECAPGEGIFAYHAEFAVGSEFDTPGAAVAGVLRTKLFNVSAADFVSKDVTVEGQGAKQFTAQTAGRDSTVMWVVPVQQGWLVDGMYGCTNTAE